MARLDSFLRLVVEQQASDLHFHAGVTPLIRHDGDLVPLNFRALSDSDTRRFLLEILTTEQRAAFERDQEIDFIYELPNIARFRANMFQQARGIGSVFRIVPNHLPTVEELHLPPVVKKLTRLQNGLVLITGPTGSGKTTTMAALVHEINKTSSRHIITIEDPIEYVHQPIQSVITQRQVGKHVESFASALRSSLRESPDVVVAGEMRDLETIQVALQAAETGVLVLGTLHTNSASKAADRVIDVFSEESREQIRGAVSVLLRGVLAQMLVKRADGEGRMAAMEVMLQTVGISNLIRENKCYQIDAYLQTADPGSGMQSLDSCLFQYVKDGLITLEEGLRVANFPEVLKRLAAELPEEV
jgi:twitching motility protein PilT